MGMAVCGVPGMHVNSYTQQSWMLASSLSRLQQE
jgi:hypothetical protein